MHSLSVKTTYERMSEQDKIEFMAAIENQLRYRGWEDASPFQGESASPALTDVLERNGCDVLMYT